MTLTKTQKTTDRLYLDAVTAADLMTPSPVSIGEEVTVREATTILAEKEINAAPVIDEAGRPVGVLSRADLVRYHHEKAAYLAPFCDYYEKAELRCNNGEAVEEDLQVEMTDPTTVREIMTPTVLAVEPQTPVLQVVAEMLALKVHRLFVRDKDGILVGVISALDVLRKLRKAQAV